MRPGGIWHHWHQTWCKHLDSTYLNMHAWIVVFLTEHFWITPKESVFRDWQHQEKTQFLDRFFPPVFICAVVLISLFIFIVALSIYCCWLISNAAMICCYVNVIVLDGLSVMRRGLSTWRPSFRTTRRTWPLRTLLPRSSRLPPATGQREVQVRHNLYSFIFLFHFPLLVAIYFTILLRMYILGTYCTNYNIGVISAVLTQNLTSNLTLNHVKLQVPHFTCGTFLSTL